MRQDKEPFRESGMDDDTLSRRSDEVCNCLERDLADLGPKNIDAKTIADLRQQREDFDNLPTDGEMESVQTEKRKEKDKAREALELVISQVAGCAADEWGYQSPQYDRYGVKGMDDQDDATLLRTAQRVIRASNAQLADLAKQGLTADMIAEVDTKRLAFRDALDAFDDAVNDRAEAARTRVLAHNSLYEALSGPAKRAQRFFKPRNATRFSDYVLFPEEGGADAPTTPPQA